MQTAGKKKVFEFCICGFEGTVYHCIYSSLAQSVEHAAVNRRVVGSSPTGGAILTRMPPLPQVAAYVNQKVTGVGL